MIWSKVAPRTLWADAVSDWLPVPAGYLHGECGARLDFLLFSADPYRRPLLALCPGCGQAWERRQARQDWRAVA